MSYSRFLEYLEMGRVKKVRRRGRDLRGRPRIASSTMHVHHSIHPKHAHPAHTHTAPLPPISPTTHVYTHACACPTHYVYQVDLYENGTIAIVEAVSPELGNRVQRVRVQLPGTSPELLQKFREKKIDFAAHTNNEDGGAVFLNLLGE